MNATSEVNAGYRLENESLRLYGAFTFAEVARFAQDIRQELRNYKRQQLIIDLQRLEEIDSAGLAALGHFQRTLHERKIKTEIGGASEAVAKKMATFLAAEAPRPRKRRKPSFLINLGDQTYRFLGQAYAFIVLTADILYWSVVDLFTKRGRRKGEFYNQAVLIGVNAAPIVLGLSFIIGLVLALQSAAQLRNFGANIYIVDLTVIAMMREMGPLITAILVAGRSGSAIAAEIAAMKVTSELDALTTMALNPIRFVITPKMHGAIFTLPFLTILADMMGIGGGMTVAYFYLDIAPEVFFNRMGDTLFVKDILTGFIKSLVFAAIIVLTGAYCGYQVKQGAEGVGKATTLAVVAAISLVIIADSIFGLIFY